MAILLTTVASGYGGNSTWELQRPEGVDTGIVVTYDNGSGQVTVPDLSLTAGDYWLEHTLTPSFEGVVTKQFTAYDLSVTAGLLGSETNCNIITTIVSGGSGDYSYTYRKDSLTEGAIVYGPTTDSNYDPSTEGTTKTPGSTNDYYVIVTDNVTGCTANDMVTNTACAFTTDRTTNYALSLIHI